MRDGLNRFYCLVPAFFLWHVTVPDLMANYYAVCPVYVGFFCFGLLTPLWHDWHIYGTIHNIMRTTSGTSPSDQAFIKKFFKEKDLRDKAAKKRITHKKGFEVASNICKLALHAAYEYFKTRCCHSNQI